MIDSGNDAAETVRDAWYGMGRPSEAELWADSTPEERAMFDDQLGTEEDW